MDTETTAVEPLRKIRPKDVMETSIKPKDPEGWGRKELFLVYGKATGIRFTDVGGYGDSYALKGVFGAERIHDGKRFASKECFLPEPMHSHIVEEFKTAEERDEDKPVIEFAYRIGIKEATNMIGYEYTTLPIIQPESSEPLADLRAKMLEQLQPAKMQTTKNEEPEEYEDKMAKKANVKAAKAAKS